MGVDYSVLVERLGHLAVTGVYDKRKEWLHAFFIIYNQMKRIFYNMVLCVAFVMAAMAMTGCSDSDSDDFENGKSIKLQKLELDGAKYFSLTGNNSRAAEDDEVGLFKIDDKGNMTTVVLSCTEEEDGTVTRTRKDIKVIPRYIYSLSGIYTLMLECKFKDGEGNDVYMNQYYEPEAWEFNILVRNTDGAIFYIPKVLSEEYFYMGNERNLQNTVADSKGNLFLFSERNLGSVTTQDGQVVLKQINPSTQEVFGDKIVPFDNGTVMTYLGGSDRFHGIFFYPNGGFEIYDGEKEGIISVTKLASGVKAVKSLTREISYNQTEYTVSLHDFNVGTSVGGNTLSAPLASIISASYDSWGIKRDGVYETKNTYVIGTSFVVDKRTMEMHSLEGVGIIFPTEKNTYKGFAWNVGEWGAEWCDIENLQSGTVNFNLPTDFEMNDCTPEIPSGKLIVYGTRYADGKSVTYFVDIETGNYVYTETESNRPITALVPLN